MLLKLLLFGLVIYLAGRGLSRLMRSVLSPPDEHRSSKSESHTEHIDPRQVKDASYRDLDE